MIIDVVQFFVCYQVVFNVFEGDIFGFWDQLEGDVDKGYVECCVELEGVGGVNCVKQCQESGVDDYV